MNLLFLFFVFPWMSVYSDTECPNIILQEDRRNDKNTLRLVQYNVEWLFIDYYSGSDCPGNGCTWKNLSEAQIHMDYVSKVVNTLKPDIINFCEIEGCDELKILSSLLEEDNAYLPYLKKGTDTGTGQNVGILTKIDPVQDVYRTDARYDYPINGSKCGYTGPITSTGVSKHSITEFKINNIDIAFISAHLIAIPTDPTRCSQREAQAMVLQEVIYNYIQKKYEIIMMGDFNDYDSEIPDINNDMPISHVLDIFPKTDTMQNLDTIQNIDIMQKLIEYLNKRKKTLLENIKPILLLHKHKSQTQNLRTTMKKKETVTNKKKILSPIIEDKDENK